MRVFLDTDVMVAALRSDQGASRQLLLLALDRRMTIVLSVPLVVEYEAVLMRPEHLLSSGLSENDVNTILDAVMLVSEPVKLRFLWRPQLKDPADEMVLETAVSGRADLLLTFNVRHMEAAAATFGIQVQRPAEGLRQIRKSLRETT